MGSVREVNQMRVLSQTMLIAVDLALTVFSLAILPLY